jgi:hypothetical protein
MLRTLVSEGGLILFLYQIPVAVCCFIPSEKPSTMIFYKEGILKPNLQRQCVHAKALSQGVSMFSVKYIDKKKKKKIIATLIVVLIGVLAATSILDKTFELSFLNSLDRKGNSYFEETMKRAFFTFALARGLNGIISVIQGTQVSISAVAGVSVSVGELLDPVNDLIERFSWVMLIATASLGIQKVFMEIGTGMGFKLVLTLSMTVMLISIWTPCKLGDRLKSAGYKMVMLALLIRFSMPCSAVITDGAYHLFLKDKYNKSIALLEKSKKELQKISIAGMETGMQSGRVNVLDMLTGFFLNSKKEISIKEKLSILKDKLSDYAGNVIDLVVVFAIQTVIIPLVMLWVIIWLLRSIVLAKFNEMEIKALP